MNHTWIALASSKTDTNQAWWVYVSIAAGCAVLFILIKVVESKYVKDELAFDILKLALGFFGIFALIKAGQVLNL